MLIWVLDSPAWLSLFFMTVSGERLSDPSANHILELQHGVPKQKRCNPQAQA